MDVYNRGRWQEDPEAAEPFVRMNFFGRTTTYHVYTKESTVLCGQLDGAFIAIRETAQDEQGAALVKYPYLVTINLQPYQFKFAAPDFVCILLFCREYHPFIAQRNQDLISGE